MNTLITDEDIDYFEKQGDISLMLSGMMSLLQDSDNKVEEIQKQNWFGRMWKTVTGKNKATKEEVRQNHEKLSVYMTQAMELLFEKNVMSQQIVNNLGNQLNVLYQEHNHLKEMLGGFVEKLNEKIISIDNFHMLSEEIRLKMYTNDKTVIAIYKVVTQLDERTVKDPRKMEILQQSLVKEGVLSKKSIPLEKMFKDLLTCTPEEAGQFILGLGAIRQHYLPSLFLEFLETYYYMSDMERKLKSKEKFTSSYMDMKQIERGTSLTSFELYQNNVENLKESFALLSVSENLPEKSKESKSDEEKSKSDEEKSTEPQEETRSHNQEETASCTQEESENESEHIDENKILLEKLKGLRDSEKSTLVAGAAGAAVVAGAATTLFVPFVGPVLSAGIGGTLLGKNFHKKKDKSETEKAVANMVAQWSNTNTITLEELEGLEDLEDLD